MKTLGILGPRNSGKTHTAADIINQVAVDNPNSKMLFIASSYDMLSLMMSAIKDYGYVLTPPNGRTHDAKAIGWSNGSSAYGFSYYNLWMARGMHPDLVWIDEPELIPNYVGVFHELIPFVIDECQLIVSSEKMPLISNHFESMYFIRAAKPDATNNDSEAV